MRDPLLSETARKFGILLHLHPLSRAGITAGAITNQQNADPDRVLVLKKVQAAAADSVRA
jgi:hypothetical protein